jgi:thioesterase domain-containing protein
MTLQELEQKILSEIPLSQVIGLRLLSLSADQAEWSAPLAPNNINHMGTGFGGSLFCASALSCYSLVLRRLSDIGVVTNEIVIAGAEIRYLKPVRGDFSVRARPRDDQEWASFENMLKTKKKARATLAAELVHNGQLCGQFEGKYAVFLP